MEKLLNILSVQVIKKIIIKSTFVNKIMKQLIFRYFNIRNFDILEYRSFYIWSFQILYPIQNCENILKKIPLYSEKYMSPNYPINIFLNIFKLLCRINFLTLFHLVESFRFLSHWKLFKTCTKPNFWLGM